MARLVGIVSRDSGGKDDEIFQKHQLPVFVDDMRTMIVEFDDPCRQFSEMSPTTNQTTLKQFRDKVSSLKPEELRLALTVKYEKFNGALLQQVPCVGCRRSVEKLYTDLSNMGHPAIFPFTIAPNFSLSVHQSYLMNVKLLYRLLIGDGQKVRQCIENLTKCRKNNKRCPLHSLDVHMCRTKLCWEELWDLMSEDCRDECCVVELDSLLDMLETYLQKHRFCTDCRAKVMKAYHLLIGESDPAQEKGYNPALYQGLRFCQSERHLHVKPSVQYLNALIDKAEPELIGGRERHAKTLDVAQGEVLICLGLYMYDRLHRLMMALRTLQNTFQLLYYTSVVAMHTNFQGALENKHGLSDSLERLCAELQDSAANPMHKNQTTKSGGMNVKRSKKKPAKSASSSSVSDAKAGSSKVQNGSECPNCTRRQTVSSIGITSVEKGATARRASPVGGQRSFSVPRSSSIVTSTITASNSICQDLKENADCAKCRTASSEKPDSGGAEDDDSSSGSSGYPDAGYCSQELSPGGGSPATGLCRAIKTPTGCISSRCENCYNEADERSENHCICHEQDEHTKSKYLDHSGVVHPNGCCGQNIVCSCTLLNMLQNGDAQEDDASSGDSLISAEDLKWFQENQSLVSDKRRALRERLQRQFNDMQQRLLAEQVKPTV